MKGAVKRQQQPCRKGMRDFVHCILASVLDERLACCQRLGQGRESGQRRVPPRVRAARLAHRNDRWLGRSLLYPGQRHCIDGVITTPGPLPLKMRLAPN